MPCAGEPRTTTYSRGGIHCNASHHTAYKQGGGHGYEAKWGIGQHNHASGTLDVSDIPNIHPLSDWQPHGWPCCKNVNSVHVPECWISHSMVGSMLDRRVGLRVGPLLNSTRHHKRPPALLYKSAWMRGLRQRVFCSLLGLVWPGRPSRLHGNWFVWWPRWSDDTGAGELIPSLGLTPTI